MSARSSVKFTVVGNVKMTDEDGFLAGSVMTNAKNTIGKERIWINRVASEILFLFLYIRTLALSYTMSASLPRILPARCH